MPNHPISFVKEHFIDLTDPRSTRGQLHKFIDIISISLLGVICGADGWTEIAEYGRSKESFLTQHLELPNGIPSEDTFARVLSLINPEEFRKCFVNWVSSISNLLGDVVNIDGKVLCGSSDYSSGNPAVCMVSAWANQANLVLGQVKVSDKSNEITAIPKLLALLDLAGSIVTIDAMGTQKQIASLIIEQSADYVLALKGNQGNLMEEVTEAFERYAAEKYAQIDEELDFGHGRIEKRKCYVAKAKDWLSPDELIKWKGLESIVKIEASFEYKNGKKKGQKSNESRYYISSIKEGAPQINQAIRLHWGIETKLHWVLDVAFREDDSRIRSNYGPENMATLRHIAVNKLKNEKSVKKGIKAKRKKAGWDDEYLIKVVMT